MLLFETRKILLSYCKYKQNYHIGNYLLKNNTAYYLFSLQVKPSFVSFTSKPRSARVFLILSLVAQSLLALAFMRSSSNMSITKKTSLRVMKLPNDLPIFCPLYYIYRFCLYLNEILGDINIFCDFCK